MIQSLLKGEARLWKAFWLFYLLASVLLAFCLQVVQIVAIRLIPYGIYVNPYAYLIFMAVVAHAYSFVAICSVWRCSRNTNHRAWFYLARLAVIAHLLWLLLQITKAIGFLLSPGGAHFLGWARAWHS